MIWSNLYLCFLMSSSGSELERSLIYVIENGTETQAKEVYNKYCSIKPKFKEF